MNVLETHGRGRYALLDIADYEKTQATIKLFGKLNKGRKSGDEKGWLSYEEVKAHALLSRGLERPR